MSLAYDKTLSLSVQPCFLLMYSETGGKRRSHTGRSAAGTPRSILSFPIHRGSTARCTAVAPSSIVLTSSELCP